MSCINTYKVVILCFLAVHLFLPATVRAEQGRALDSIRICSMNIDMLGRKDETKPKAKQSESEFQKHRKKQLGFLAERVISASCDIVAVQEIYGLSSKEANKNIRSLASAVSKASPLGLKYVYHAATTNDKRLRNGYIFRGDIGAVRISDLYRENVPSADRSSPSRRFMRGPVALSVDVASTKRSNPTKLYLVNYHLKSKADGWKDLSGLSYELNRVETAEAVRDIASRALRQGYDIVMFLGDRNSDTGSATDYVLSGIRSLDDFRGMCSIDKKFLEANCGSYKGKEPDFIGVLANKSRSLYSYKYKNKQSLIDEIYINKNSLRFVNDAGVVGEYLKGSDHLLTWVEVGI